MSKPKPVTGAVYELLRGQMAFPRRPVLNPGIRDCVLCTLPFFSRSAANVVCIICKCESTATFDGDGRS